MHLSAAAKEDCLKDDGRCVSVGDGNWIHQ